MNVTLHVNGKYEVELAPENAVERAILAEMAARAELGRPVRLTLDRENDSYKVAIEKS